MPRTSKTGLIISPAIGPACRPRPLTQAGAEIVLDVDGGTLGNTLDHRALSFSVEPDFFKWLRPPIATTARTTKVANWRLQSSESNQYPASLCVKRGADLVLMIESGRDAPVFRNAAEPE